MSFSSGTSQPTSSRLPVMLLLGLIFTLLGVVLVVVAAGLAIHTASFLAGAKRTDATVVAVHEHISRSTSTSRHHRTSSTTTTWCPEVTYQAGGQRRHVTLTTCTGNRPAVGSTLPVAYDPDKPTHVSRTGASAYLASFITGPIGLLFGVVGVVLLFFARRSA